MSTARSAPASLQRGALAYLILCLCALLLLYQVLEDRAAGNWSFFPVIVGAAGLFLRWGAAPLLLFAAVVVTMLVESNRLLFFSTAAFRVPDFLLCASVLAYAQAHYRLTLLRSPFPGEKSPPPVQRAQDDSPFISSTELGLLLLSLPAWAALAQLVWPLLPRRAGNPGLIAPVWRVVAMLWLLGATGLVMAAVLDYWYRRRMSLEEANLFLQDTLWRETRREQRRINRWFAWARIRNRPSLWQDVKANRTTLAIILIVDLILVLFILSRLA